VNIRILRYFTAAARHEAAFGLSATAELLVTIMAR